MYTQDDLPIGQRIVDSYAAWSAARSRKNAVPEVEDALSQTRKFMLKAISPPVSKEEQTRLTGTLHALDHTSRLAERVGEKSVLGASIQGIEDAHAAELCAEAMQNAALVAGEIAANGTPPQQAMCRLEDCAKELRELQKIHRKEMLRLVAGGAMSADEAISRVDTVRRLETLARSAWRAAVHLLGSGV